MSGTAVFLTGPVGVGKTTLGRLLAERLGAGRGSAFMDGDDHQAPGRPWYGSILSTSRAIVRTGLTQLEHHDVVVIAYPLRRREWVFHRHHFGDAGVRTLFVGLQASAVAIGAPGRGRVFSSAERDRVAIMVAEGYGAFPWIDLAVNTGRPIADTLADLERNVRARLQQA